MSKRRALFVERPAVGDQASSYLVLEVAPDIFELRGGRARHGHLGQAGFGPVTVASTLDGKTIKRIAPHIFG